MNPLNYPSTAETNAAKSVLTSKLLAPEPTSLRALLVPACTRLTRTVSSSTPTPLRSSTTSLALLCTLAHPAPAPPLPSLPPLLLLPPPPPLLLPLLLPPLPPLLPPLLLPHLPLLRPLPLPALRLLLPLALRSPRPSLLTPLLRGSRRLRVSLRTPAVTHALSFRY